MNEWVDADKNQHRRGEYLECEALCLGSSFSKDGGRPVGCRWADRMSGQAGCRTSRRQWWAQDSKNSNISEFLKLASQMLSLPLNLASNFSFFFFLLIFLHWRQFVHNFLQMRWQNGVQIPKAHLKNCVLEFSVYPEAILGPGSSYLLQRCTVHHIY